MGRGEENVVTEKNILFNPPKRRKEGIRDLAGKKARERALQLAEDVRQGNFFDLFYSLDQGSPQEYPVFLYAFEELSKESSEFWIAEKKFPKKAKGLAQEKQEMEKRLGLLLAERISGILQSSAKDKEELIIKALEIDYGVFAGAVLAGSGPIKEAMVERLGLTSIDKDLSPEELDFLLNSDEGKSAWESAVRRELLLFMHRAMPQRIFPKQAQYGVFHGFRKDGTMHILNEKGRTLCSDNPDIIKRRRINHGSWRDDFLLKEKKRCPQCQKKADPELLHRIEEERGDDESEYLGQKAQDIINKASRSEDLRRKARNVLLKGKTAYLADMVRREAFDEVLSSYLEAANDPEALLLNASGGHIIWSVLKRKTCDMLAEKGYKTPESLLNHSFFNKSRPEEFANSLKREEDVLPSLLSREDQKEYLRDMLLAALEGDTIARQKAEAKAGERINAKIQDILLNDNQTKNNS